MIIVGNDSEYYLSNISSVKKDQVPIKGSKGAYIPWLVTKDHGAHYAVRKFTLEPHGVIPMHVHKCQETVIMGSPAFSQSNPNASNPRTVVLRALKLGTLLAI